VHHFLATAYNTEHNITGSSSVNLAPQGIAMTTLYDKQTGIRTVTPQNVNGNWDAHLGGFDPLGNLSRSTFGRLQGKNIRRTINAQGRTETWYRSLPHYVMLHLVYHWNQQSSKRKANLD